MSPEAVSPYPDRPIRPLPKKPLRERLSPDVAQSIKYPPAPKTTNPLFYYGYHSREEEGLSNLLEPQHPSERERAAEIERNYISRRTGDDVDSEEDEQAYRSRLYSRPSADTTGRSYRYVQKPDTKHPNPQPPGSTASSADGYDSFENTNNKKKRKIPTPGDSILNGSHLSNDMAVMGISGPDDLIDDVGHGIGSYNGSGVGQGISGPGRGRYGRIRNGRSPLRTLSDASGNWGNGRSTKQRQPQWPSTRMFTRLIFDRFTDTSKTRTLALFLSRSLLPTLRNSPSLHHKDKRIPASYSKHRRKRVQPRHSSRSLVILRSLALCLGLAQPIQELCIKVLQPE